MPYIPYPQILEVVASISLQKSYRNFLEPTIKKGTNDLNWLQVLIFIEGINDLDPLWK
jgi:hypothetical protein